MTIKEIYETTIKPLAAGDRAALANLILEDLGREPPKAFHSEDELEALLLAGLNSGSAVPVTASYWQKKKDSLVQSLSHHISAE